MTKKFEDFLNNKGYYQILKFEDFGEYRKGSTEYGTLVQDVMLFLRNFKNDKKNLIFKIKDIKFDYNKLYDLLRSENKQSLISFDVKFLDKDKKDIEKPVEDGFIVFYNLTDNKKDRPWENKSNR
jgi:adenylate cyclase